MTSFFESAHSANSNNIVIPNAVRDPWSVRHRFAGGSMQFAHQWQRVFTHADSALDQIAKLQQTDAETVIALIDPFHHAIIHQRSEYAVRGGRALSPR